MQGLSSSRQMATAGIARGTAHASSRAASTYRLESRRLSACADIAEFWNALARRAVTPNPFFEPGFLLPAAQHLVSFRDIAVLLAWQDGGAGQERRLLGFMPYRRKARILRGESLTGCEDDRLLCDWPLIDGDAAVPVAGALLRAARASGLVAEGLRWHALAPDNPLRLALTAAAQSERLALNAILRAPPASLGGSVTSRTELSLHEARNQGELRDGVEILMGLEASGAVGRAGLAAVQDNREAAFLRAMSRNLARDKLCRVSLLMEDSRTVAAALTLGRGKRRWLYKLTAADTDNPRDAEERAGFLLALMQRRSPGLELLACGDQPALVSARPEIAIHDLAMTDPASRKPADLAQRLRARLDRGLFRPRLSTAGG